MHIQLGNTIELKPVNNIEVTLLFSGTVTQNDNPIPAPLTSEVYANNELISARHFTSSADGAFNIVQTLPKERLAEELGLAVSMVGGVCRVTKTISYGTD